VDITKDNIKEYNKWYRAYIDGQISELENTDAKAATSAISTLSSAKIGNNVNV